MPRNSRISHTTTSITKKFIAKHLSAGPAPSESSFRLDVLATRLFQWLFPLAIILAPLHLGGVPLWSFSIAVFLLAASFSFYWFSAPPAKKLPVIHTALDRWVVAYLLFFFFLSFSTKRTGEGRGGG